MKYELKPASKLRTVHTYVRIIVHNYRTRNSSDYFSS